MNVEEMLKDLETPEAEAEMNEFIESRLKK